MGSFSELYISHYSILSNKNGYYEDVVNLIFQKSDFIIYSRPINELGGMANFNNEIPVNIETETIKAFCTTAKICKERLELFGANYEKAERDFNNAMTKLKEEEYYQFAEVSNLTYKAYLENIKSIIESNQKKYDNDYYNNFIDYLHENELFIENQSINLALWSILNVVEPECKIEYDLTEIIAGGWISDSPQNNINIEKIIILTEGKTDAEFLLNCLTTFYPHIKDYYHFMDFETSKYEANASRLVHTIKSFVGSGINNLIIAIFDNDTAGLKEVNNLKKVKLPSNIKVLQYPTIELAKNYPTIGPNGIQNMDVNGLAGSIEMYLGIDCLTEDNELIPIHWKGYDDSVKQYQGVILEKNDVQERFKQKVKSFDRNNFRETDWKELKSIIELLNNTWQNTD